MRVRRILGITKLEEPVFLISDGHSVSV